MINQEVGLTEIVISNYFVFSISNSEVLETNGVVGQKPGC